MSRPVSALTLRRQDRAVRAAAGRRMSGGEGGGGAERAAAGGGGATDHARPLLLWLAAAGRRTMPLIISSVYLKTLRRSLCPTSTCFPPTLCHSPVPANANTPAPPRPAPPRSILSAAARRGAGPGCGCHCLAPCARACPLVSVGKLQTLVQLLGNIKHLCSFSAILASCPACLSCAEARTTRMRSCPPPSPGHAP